MFVITGDTLREIVVTNDDGLRRIGAGIAARQAYVDSLKWRQIQAALTGQIIDGDGHYGHPDNVPVGDSLAPKPKPPALKHPAPRNRKERRDEARRLGKLGRRTP